MSMLQSPMSMPAFGGYAPLATGSAYQPFHMFGNAFGNGVFGMGMQMVGQPMLQQMMSQQGAFPLGFGHSQNMYDISQRLQFQRMYEKSMSDSRSAEAQQMMHSMRGMAHLAGTPWNMSTYDSASSLSSFLARGAPILAQMAPDVLEGLGGRIGSPTLLMHNLMMGGRYRADPVTGQLGMTGASAGAIRDHLMATAYDTGDATRMYGITAGRAGQTFDELTRRGLVPQLDRTATLGRITGKDIAKMSGAELDALTEMPGVADKLRSFDARKVKDTLQKYSQTIAAMREVFGDNGHPNAPIPQLLQALEEMTMGGMSQFSPASLTNMVRSTHNLAKAAGIPFEAAQHMTMQGAVFANQMGLNPAFGPQFAQGGMSFHAGLQGMVPTWGQLSRAGLTQLDMSKRAGAAGSEIANQLAALMRLRENSGGLAGPAEQIARDIEQGNSTAAMHMTADTFTKMMGASGFNAGDVRAALRQTGANEEYLHKFKISDITRDLQPIDTKKSAHEYIRNSVYRQLRDTGMDNTTAWAKAEEAAAKGTTQLFNMTREQMADTTERNRLLGQSIHDSVGKGVLKGYYGVTGSLAYGELEGATSSGVFGPNLKNFVNVLEANRPETLAAAAKQRQLNQARQMFQTPLSQFAAPDTVLGNLIGGLQGLKQGASMKDYILKAMNGVDIGDVQHALEAPLIRLKKLQDDFDVAYKNYERDQSPENHAKLRSLATELTKEGGALSAIQTIKGAGDLYSTMGPKVVGTASRAMSEFKSGRTAFIGALSNMSRADRDKLWGSTSGKLMRERVGNMMGSTDSLLAASFSEDFVLKKGGREGLQATRSMQSARDRLQALADKHTGGDISRLAVGDIVGLKDDELKAVQTEVRGLTQIISESQTTLSKLDAAPVVADKFKGKEEGLKTELARLNETRDARSLFQQMLARTVGSADKAKDMIASGDYDKTIEKLGSSPNTMRDMRLVVSGRGKGIGAAALDEDGQVFNKTPEDKARMVAQKTMEMAEAEENKRKNATAAGDVASTVNINLTSGELTFTAEDKVKIRAKGKGDMKRPAVRDAER